MLQTKLNEFPLRVTSVSRVFIKIEVLLMGAFSTRMRFVLLSTHKQPLENQPLPGSFSQLVQIGRWWQNLWACGRTFRRGTRRSCSFQFQHLCSLQLPQEPVLTISTGFFDRTHTDPLRPQLVTCCRWCTRILSAGHTPFRHTPVWAEWRRSCSRLLLTCSPQRELLSRFMSALSTATGQWSLDKKVLWSSLSKLIQIQHQLETSQKWLWQDHCRWICSFF